ncbi:hypothetical protein IHE44_0013182 [Lamprotornis superbus]|uniref:ADP-ribosylation factor-like protein 9 n=1 Tax=Lamprotornis superbus TaxID=245042 RepID=A0A835ND28_9PASS|nr:hypothetical protein IHE44_0013182 [Lamprotornis superbus]
MESKGVVLFPVGGSEPLRSYWKMYLPKVLLLVYVVDSADHARLPMAKQLLHQLIQNNSTLPVVVLANKQDLEGAHCITDIHDALALSDIGDERKMFLIGTHVAEDGSEISSGMKDAKELIGQLMHKAENSTLTTGSGCSLLFQLRNKMFGCGKLPRPLWDGQHDRDPCDP